MATELTLPCADGGYEDECYGRVAVESVSSSYHKLTDAQKQEFAEQAQEHTTRDEFSTEIDDIEVSAEPAVCAACGSDS